MKLAFLNLYSGINQRGVESLIHELANRLSREHEVVFFQGGEKTPEQQTAVTTIESRACQPRSEFPSGFFGKLAKRLFLDPANRSVLVFSLKLLPRLLRGGFDLVFPANGFWQILFLKLMKPLTKSKIIVIGNSGPGWDERFNLYLKPDLFIAVTPSVRDWAGRVCPGTRVELIPPAIDPQAYRQTEPARLSLKRPVILCPAAAVAYKRVDLAIRAAAKLSEVSLLLLGRGEQEAALRALGQRLLGSRFAAAAVDHDRMPAYYRAADLVTYPSAAQENAPMVFLEALAAGKLVVARDTERNRWLLGPAGVYCRPEDPEDYARALRLGLKRSGQPSLSAPFARQLAKFSWPRVIKSYQSVIRSL